MTDRSDRAGGDGLDTTMWQWDKIAEAAFVRACQSNRRAANELRSAFRAIIEAGLRASPPSGNAGEKAELDIPLERLSEIVRSEPDLECSVGPPQPAPDALRQALTSLKQIEAWLKRERYHAVAEQLSTAIVHLSAPVQSGVRGDREAREALIRELCGDDLNGGFIRDLCFTVWKICHEPKHQDGNSDWSSDTLPTVQEAVKIVRAKLIALSLQPTGDQRAPQVIGELPHE